MKAVIQRVTRASVEVNGKVVGQIRNGVFGAHMKVELLNDGPVTFVLDSRA